MDGLYSMVGLGALLSEALLGFEAAAFGGFGLFLGVSFHRGHGDFLRLDAFFYQTRRKPCPI
jgi:hypothetical protein